MSEDGKIAFLVRLKKDKLEKLKAVAERKGIPYTILAASYIIEKLEEEK